MSWARAGVGVLVGGALAACGGGGAAGTATPEVPVRAPTAGDALLARLPPGAEVVVEVDLARLRGNAVVGEVATALLAAPPAVTGAAAAPLVGATAVALAAYRVGTPEASTITIVAGGARPAEALDLGEARWALAVEGDVAALLATADDGPSLAGDAALQATRAWAMPAAADGAALRLTARLPPAARAALAAALGVDAAPAAVSVWGDVADDLAVVVRLGDEPPVARPPWLPAVERLRARLAATAELGALGLARPVADAALRRDGAGVRVALVIAPGRLRRAVARWRAQPVLSSSPGASP